MTVEKVQPGTPLFEEVLSMLPGYYMDVEGWVQDESILRVYLGALVDHGHVYAISGGGFMVVDRKEDVFYSKGWYWIVHMAYVVPEKRRSSVLSRLLNAVKCVHKGEIRAMSYAKAGTDFIMAKRYRHIGNIYCIQE